MADLPQLAHKGPVACPAQGCSGNVVWFGDDENSITGRCLSCKTYYTFLRTSKPEDKDAVYA